jgi:hypothetical protein
MWRKKGPKAGHRVVVLYADPRDGSYAPYYMGQCDCGWFSNSFADESSAFDAARSHAEHVDLDVRKPLDPDYRPH